MTVEAEMAEAARKAEEEARRKRANGAAPSVLISYADATIQTGSDYWIKGLLESSALALVFGASGSGKTFATLDLALHVAAGLAWRNRRVRRGGVLYVAAEAGRPVLTRVVAWRQDRGIGKAAFIVYPEAVNLLDEAALMRFIARCREAAAMMGGLAVIVFDTLSRCLVGAEENESRTMSAVVAACDRLRAELGASVLLVHHTGKDADKGARGHSSLFAACDTVLKVADGALTVEKRRDGVAGETFGFTLEPVELGRDQDGDPISTCIVRPGETTTKRAVKAIKLSAPCAIALAALQQAVAEAGTTPPASNHIPAVVKAVTVDQWRTYAYARKISDGEQNARRMAFNRAAEQLQAKKMVAGWQGLVWPCE